MQNPSIFGEVLLDREPFEQKFWMKSFTFFHFFALLLFLTFLQKSEEEKKKRKSKKKQKKWLCFFLFQSVEAVLREIFWLVPLFLLFFFSSEIREKKIDVVCQKANRKRKKFATKKVCNKKRRARKNGKCKKSRVFRRERDSNPRYEGISYNGLAISRFRPLSHLSVLVLYFFVVFFLFCKSWTRSKGITAKLVYRTGAHQKKVFLAFFLFHFFSLSLFFFFTFLQKSEKKRKSDKKWREKKSLFHLGKVFWKKTTKKFFEKRQQKSFLKKEKTVSWRQRKPEQCFVLAFAKKRGKKKNHPGTKLIFPARLPTSLSTSLAFHSQVRDGLAWFHKSIEHQSISGAKLRRFFDVSNPILLLLFFSFFSLFCKKMKKKKSEKEEGWKNIGQNQLAFSISQLKPLLALHLIPIKQLVLLRLYGEYSSWSGLRT